MSTWYENCLSQEKLMTVAKHIKKTKDEPEWVKLTGRSLLAGNQNMKTSISQSGWLKQHTRMLDEQAFEVEMSEQERDKNTMPPLPTTDTGNDTYLREDFGDLLLSPSDAQRSSPAPMCQKHQTDIGHNQDKERDISGARKRVIYLISEPSTALSNFRTPIGEWLYIA